MLDVGGRLASMFFLVEISFCSKLPPWIVFKVSAAFRWEPPGMAKWCVCFGHDVLHTSEVNKRNVSHMKLVTEMKWKSLMSERVWVTSFWWLAAKFLHWEFSNHCCNLSRIPQRGWIWAAAGRNYTNWMNFKRLKMRHGFLPNSEGRFFSGFLVALECFQNWPEATSDHDWCARNSSQLAEVSQLGVFLEGFLKSAGWLVFF